MEGIVKNRQEEGVLVGEGGFLTDKEAARRKLGADRMKIWKHRTLVIWEEFKILFYGMGIAFVATPGALYPLINGDCRYLSVFDTLQLMVGYSIIGIFLTSVTLSLLLASFMAAVFVIDYFQTRLSRIRKEWSVDDFSERINRD